MAYPISRYHIDTDVCGKIGSILYNKDQGFIDSHPLISRFVSENYNGPELHGLHKRPFPEECDNIRNVLSEAYGKYVTGNVIVDSTGTVYDIIERVMMHKE